MEVHETVLLVYANSLVYNYIVNRSCKNDGKNNREKNQELHNKSGLLKKKKEKYVLDQRMHDDISKYVVKKLIQTSAKIS